MKGRIPEIYMKAKGKNFSTNNVTGNRKASDAYETPYSLTRQLLEREKFPNLILEPACGNRAIVKVLNDFDYDVIAVDINMGINFLSIHDRYPAIVTNPPFSLAYEFIQHAKTLCDKFAFLLPLSYLHGKERHDNIWMDKKFPLKRIYVFTRYPMLGEPLRTDGKYHTGMMVYAWYIWEKKKPLQRHEKPIIEWIDNQEFVIGKND